MALGKTSLSKLQLGNDSTASNNFLLKIPASPNGTVVLANGNDGSETDLIAFNSTGNIVMNSGKGIDFSATANSSGTMTSELFNDYEEGTWTPTLGGTATYTGGSAGQVGTYTKIGRVVNVNLDLQVNTIGTGSTTTISGLPFTVSGVRNSCGLGYWINLAVNVLNIQAYAGGGGSTIGFISQTVAGGSCTDAPAIFGNGSRVIMSITYQAS